MDQINPTDGIIANVVIIIALLVLLAAFAITFFSVYHSLRMNKRKAQENGVPVGMIQWATVGMLLIIALPSLIFGGVASMCLITTILMLFIATGTLVFSKINTSILRKNNNV